VLTLLWVSVVKYDLKAAQMSGRRWTPIGVGADGLKSRLSPSVKMDIVDMNW
jgi:hypothetical protein